MEKNAIPKATLGRLPQYLAFLKEHEKKGTPHISATAIAKALSLGEVQVRKDLGQVSGEGKPKIGYVTADLTEQLEKCLGHHRLANAVLVGAGKLGRALLDYDEFENYGVRIAAAFDCDEQVLHPVHNKEILPMCRFEAFCRSENVQIGIITVGKDSAQSVCDRMLECGITAIWNFAPCKLHVPEGFLLKQENLALSLAHLNNQLSVQYQEKAASVSKCRRKEERI